MRIAIYSRKSKWTGKWESIENQLAMCREYIMANFPHVNSEEIYEYEDEGFSGKNTQRPQFQKMMSAIKREHFDYLVCYKLDRLGRNLLDLVNLIEELNKLDTSFISIKEKFDTSTPIGRAMMFFTGVLAQMEREQIAERVRDNMMMLARSGRWLGGTTPLGFNSKKVETIVWNNKVKTSYRLVINEKEMDTVRFIYQKYLEQQSLTWLDSYFTQNNICTRNGKEYQVSTLRDILTNPVYCTAEQVSFEYFKQIGCQVCIDEDELDGVHGLIGYGKTSSRKYKNKPNEPEEWIISLAKHKGIITGEEWVRVQRILEVNKKKGASFRKVQNSIALLPGLLYCKCGYPMRPKNYPANRLDEKGQRTFAYLCTNKEKTKRKNCSVANVHGNTLDQIIWEQLLTETKLDSNVHEGLRSLLEDLNHDKAYKASEIDMLMNVLDDKKNSIQQLIIALSKSDGDEAFVDYVKEQIHVLDLECKDLINQIENKKYAYKGHLTATKFGKDDELSGSVMRLSLERQLVSLTEAFHFLSIQEKREYLTAAIEKIVWDGMTAHIYL